MWMWHLTRMRWLQVVALIGMMCVGSTKRVDEKKDLGHSGIPLMTTISVT